MRTIVSCAALILAAAPAFAGSFDSPSAFIADGERIECLIRNVGSAALEDVAAASILRATGSSVSLPSLAPGDSLISGITNGEGSLQEGWCEFAFKGSKKSARASLCLRSSTAATCSSLIAVQ